MNDIATLARQHYKEGKTKPGRRQHHINILNRAIRFYLGDSPGTYHIAHIAFDRLDLPYIPVEGKELRMDSYHLEYLWSPGELILRHRCSTCPGFDDITIWSMYDLGLHLTHNPFICEACTKE